MENEDNKSSPISSALREAEIIVMGAKEKANEILRIAKAEAQQLKEQARIEGLSLGKKEVVQASLKFFRDHEVLSKKLQKEASILAFEIIKKIFNFEDKSIIDPIQLLAKKLLETTGMDRSIVLTISPNNVGRVKAISDHINTLSGLKFTLRESKEISQDTIVMSSDLGEVQVSLSDLLEELASFLAIRS